MLACHLLTRLWLVVSSARLKAVHCSSLMVLWPSTRVRRPRLARLVMCCSVEARSPDTQAASIVVSAPLLSTWIFSSRS